MRIVSMLVMLLALSLLFSCPVSAQSNMVIYGSINCPHTRQAINDHPEAMFYDVEQDPGKFEEMLYYSNGVQLYPVIVVDGRTYIGYQGDSCTGAH